MTGYWKCSLCGKEYSWNINKCKVCGSENIKYYAGEKVDVVEGKGMDIQLKNTMEEEAIKKKAMELIKEAGDLVSKGEYEKAKEKVIGVKALGIYDERVKELEGKIKEEGRKKESRGVIFGLKSEIKGLDERIIGDLWAWGRNESGQLGDGTNKDKWKPVKIMEDVVAISVGWHHSLAIVKR